MVGQAIDLNNFVRGIIEHVNNHDIPKIVNI